MNYRSHSREDPRRSALFDIDEENSHTGEDLSVGATPLPTPHRGEQALLNEPEWSDQVSANIADHEQKSANALGHLLENAERFLYDEVDSVRGSAAADLIDLKDCFSFLRVTGCQAGSGAPPPEEAGTELGGLSGGGAVEDEEVLASHGVLEEEPKREVPEVQPKRSARARPQWVGAMHGPASPRTHMTAAVHQAIFEHLWRQLIPAFVPILRSALPPARGNAGSLCADRGARPGRVVVEECRRNVNSRGAPRVKEAPRDLSAPAVGGARRPTGVERGA